MNDTQLKKLTSAFCSGEPVFYKKRIRKTPSIITNFIGWRDEARDDALAAAEGRITF